MPTLVRVDVEASSVASETILFDESVDSDNGIDVGEGVGGRTVGSPGTLVAAGGDHEMDIDVSVRFDRLDDDDDVEDFQYDIQNDLQSPMRAADTLQSQQVDLSTTIFSQDSRTVSGSPSRRQSPPASRVAMAAHQKRRETGPNQILYKSKYETHVKSEIQSFRQRFPGKLRDYKLMTVDEKEAEQMRLLDFLNRLKLNEGDPNLSPPSEDPEYMTQRNPLDEGTAVPFVSSGSLNDQPTTRTAHSTPSVNFDHFSTDQGGSVNVDQRHDNTDKVYSRSRLESIDGETSSNYGQSTLNAPAASTHSFRTRDIPESESHHSTTSDAASAEPVERARFCGTVASRESDFSSPERRKPLSGHKRNASMSGKRGADMSRFRYDDEPSPIFPVGSDDSDDDLRPFTQPVALDHPPSPPGGNHAIFQASQSPIARRFTQYVDSPANESSDESVVYMGGPKEANDQSERSLAMECSRGAGMDTITTHETDESGRTERHHLRELSTNLNLREDAVFHLDKLSIRYSELELLQGRPDHRRRRLVDFPDPLRKYAERVKKRLNFISKWIHKRETNDPQKSSRGAVFSLRYGQIIDVVIKIMDAFRAEDCDKRRSSKTIQGKTIIVTRSKEDLVEWEHALREKSDFSVMNHAALKREDRKRAPMAKKCALYDVVLTTFDALKASDVTVAIDESGHAITKRIREKDGWYSSRSNSSSSSSSSANPLNCKQLSILHKIEFRRVIFTDMLGRGSYLAKSGTARSVASVALHADSRFAFFERNENSEVPAITSFTRSDKKASLSVGAALRLEEEHGADDFFELYGMDYMRIKSNSEKTNKSKSKTLK